MMLMIPTSGSIVLSFPYNNLVANMELMYLTSCGYGIIAGAIVADRDVLINLIPIIVMPLLLLSGFFVKITKDVHIMWVLHYISPCKYGFAAGIQVSSLYTLRTSSRIAMSGYTLQLLPAS